MSGSQQQRTSIARASINSPEISLADEPSGSLESESAIIVYDILRDISEQCRTIFLIITFNRRIAQKADRFIETKDGRIYLDLRNQPAVKTGKKRVKGSRNLCFTGFQA